MRYLLIILTLSFMLFACSKPHADVSEKDGVLYINNYDIPVEDSSLIVQDVVFESSPEDSIYFQSIVDVLEDEDGNVYILDKKGSALYKYDFSGNFVSQLCSKGMGPGEVNLPNNMCFTEKGNIIIADSENEKFLEITKNGEYVRSMKSPFYQGGFIFSYGTDYLVATNQGMMFGDYAENYLYVVSDSLKIKKRFGEPVKTDQMMESFVKNLSEVAVRDGAVISAFYAENKIDVFREDRLHSRITRKLDFDVKDVAFKKGMNNGRETTFLDFDYVTSAAEISPDGNIYVLTLVWGDSNKADYKEGMPFSYLEVYGSDGVIKKKYPVHRSANNLYINDKGFIYMVDNEEQAIIRYKPL